MTTRQPPPRPIGPQLKVSAFDRVASMVIALLVMVGATVACLLIIWLTSQLFDPIEAVPVKLENLGGGSPDGVVGESLKLDAPEREEIAEETDVIEPKLQETVAMMTDVATKVADLDQPIFEEDLESGGGGSTGTGDRRGFGEGPGDGGSGPAWEMMYDESSLSAYRQQLDFFGIELAVIGGSRNQIEYASGFSGGRPTRRVGTRDEELNRQGGRRTYFSHRSGTVQKYDRQLLAQAGINTRGRIILQYYTKAAEGQLLLLQQKHRGLDQQDIRKTVFGIRRGGNAYEFYVVDQIPR